VRGRCGSGDKGVVIGVCEGGDSSEGEGVLLVGYVLTCRPEAAISASGWETVREEMDTFQEVVDVVRDH
jgi:hypothetical protein